LVATIVGAVPVVLALVGPLLERSRPSGRVLVAALVVVAGATIATGLGSGSPTGLLFAVGALACEACFSLLAIPLLPKLGTVRVSAYTAGAFLLWYDALPLLGADRAGLFAGMVPVGAIATTFLLGLAAPTASELGGATLVIAGLAVGLTAGRPRTAADTPVAPASVAG
jgi:drug/metabolite transporter (DMT)-like permease